MHWYRYTERRFKKNNFKLNDAKATLLYIICFMRTCRCSLEKFSLNVLQYPYFQIASISALNKQKIHSKFLIRHVLTLTPFFLEKAHLIKLKWLFIFVKEVTRVNDILRHISYSVIINRLYLFCKHSKHVAYEIEKTSLLL